MATAKVLNMPEKIYSVTNREEADEALKQLGILADKIATIEIRESDSVRKAQERIVNDTAAYREQKGVIEKALEKWAKDDSGNWEARTLELNFGKLMIRLSPPAIRLKLKVEHVIERLKAKKMKSCIRVKEEIDKDALLQYDEDVIEKVGCQKVQKENFSYELKEVEAK